MGEPAAIMIVIRSLVSHLHASIFWCSETSGAPVIEKIAPSETRTRSITPVGFVLFTRSRDWMRKTELRQKAGHGASEMAHEG